MRMRALVISVLLLPAAPVQAQSAKTLAAPLAGQPAGAAQRDTAERCGGLVLVAMSQSVTPVLRDALMALANTAMAQGGRSEDVQRAMANWGVAYAQPDRPNQMHPYFEADRPYCLTLAGALAEAQK